MKSVRLIVKTEMLIFKSTSLDEKILFGKSTQHLGPVHMEKLSPAFSRFTGKITQPR